MRNFKKFMAVALTATMVIGTCVTAFAEDPVTSGGTNGAGSSEGHLDKKVINVLLPTVPSGSTPFNYTMDPERLIQETSAAKYAEGTVFPEKDSDTGVYFLTAENTYANTSNTLQAINKSSHAIKLSVKVKTTENTNKDIPLATSATVASGENATANLYLGLKVGNDTQVVSATEATVDKVIPGVAANFETAVVSGAYVYQEKANATTWKAIDISMTGAVSALPVASDTTAPTVNVTWSYTEAASTDTASTDVVDYSTAPATVSVTVKNKGDYTGEDTSVTMTVGSAAVNPTAVDGYTFAGYFTDAACETAFTGNVAADTSTLYAKWTANDVGPSIATTEYTMVANTPIEITVNLGSGNDAATGVSAVMDPTGVYDYLGGGYAEYDASSHIVTLKDSMVDACIAANVGSVNVVFDEGTSVAITLNQ